MIYEAPCYAVACKKKKVVGLNKEKYLLLRHVHLDWLISIKVAKKYIIILSEQMVSHFP